MIPALSAVGALLLSVAILMMGNGLQTTLLPIRAQIENFTTLEIGVMGSAYFAGLLVGCVLGPRLARRVGHIRLFAAMASLASTSALIHALSPEPWIWWPMRSLTGLCIAIIYMVIESWLNEQATNESRGLVLSTYTTVNLVVLGLGQMIVTVHNPAEFPLFAIASILMSLAIIPVAMTTAPVPGPVVNVRLRVGQLYAVSPVGFVGCLAVGLAHGSFWALGPVFARESGMNTTGIALFMSVAVLAGALTQWPVGRASDKVDRRLVIVALAMSAALAAATLNIVNELWRGELLAFAFLFGATSFPLYAICVAHTNDHASPDAFVETASGLLLLFGIGAVAGPVLASVVMEFAGPNGLFYHIATIYAALAAFSVLRITTQPEARGEERAPFVNVPRTAATVYALDPRSDPADTEPAAPSTAGTEHSSAV